MWLVKTDADGDSLWTKTFGGSQNDGASSVQKTTDDGYIITGRTTSMGSGSWLIKTDADGDTLWTKTHEDGNGFCVQQTTDGGFIITGTIGTDGDVLLLRTSANGDQLWTKAFGGIYFDQGSSVQQTADGGYIVAGVYHVPISNAWLIKTDAGGDTLWTKTFGGSNWDWGHSVQKTSDGGYIITGTTQSSGTGDSDVWLIKIAPDVTAVEGIHIINDYQLQQNYPNPFNPNTTIRFQLLEANYVTMDVFDIMGRKVQTLIDQRKEIGLHEVNWDGTNEEGGGVASGIYMYKLRAGSLEQSRKMVLLR